MSPSRWYDKMCCRWDAERSDRVGGVWEIINASLSNAGEGEDPGMGGSGREVV